jgi:Fe2+ or Zn2+ uptake regulation protein
MTSATRIPKSHDDQICMRLSDHEVRYTSGRQRVVSALADADGPRSAAELHDDLDRGLPLSSLYRSLAVMADAGVLDQHNGTKGLTRYELSEWLLGHHHHLVCDSCGTVEDVEIPEPLEARLEELISTITVGSAFSATGHSLEIDGLCRRCA